MMISFIIAGSLILYSGLAGLTWFFADEHTDWNEEARIFSTILWPIFLPGLVIYACTNVISRYVENKRITGARPSILIKKGAKVETFSEYRKVKQLVTDFEIENGFDKLLEE